MARTNFGRDSKRLREAEKPQPKYPPMDVTDKAINAKLRADSGSRSSKDPLVSFLYHLMRDVVPVGEVEGLARTAVKNADALYSNGFLLQYAENIAARLTAAQPATEKEA